MASSQSPDVPTPAAEMVPPSTPGSDAGGAGSRADVVARVPDFAELRESAEGQGAAPLDRLLDVDVTVTAELGRAVLSIGDILKLNIGSVLELDRPVSEPVDLMVQGVRLARGEVVVVDDCFAIRVKEIVVDAKKRAA